MKADEVGRHFTHDIRAIGVHFATAPSADGPGHGAQLHPGDAGRRAHHEHLSGACQNLGPEDVDAETVAAARIIYLEGYLWDPPAAKQAFRRAAQLAHAAGRKVALTLSDSFCVDRYRDEFLDLMRSGSRRHPVRQ